MAKHVASLWATAMASASEWMTWAVQGGWVGLSGADSGVSGEYPEPIAEVMSEKELHRLPNYLERFHLQKNNKLYVSCG